MSMTFWIKICGLTTDEAVRAAVDEGADAIGFVFAQSKRQVTAKQAVELTQEVPPRVARVAVMQHPGQRLLDEVWRVFRPDILQTDAEDFPALCLPEELRTIPVVRQGEALPVPLPSRFLYEGTVSGAGESVDWMAAAELACRAQLILAGGLTVSNVAAAITNVRPAGVDVSSGVERTPGVKDPHKIHAFIKAARVAAAQLHA
jgi:phosphoribosylanthranilate isomerase